jgi:mannose-6-phosphate isomerase
VLESRSLEPIQLGPNQPPGRPYRGGSGIARLRGLPSRRDDVPEDFLASTTQVAGDAGAGLTVLADGRTLLEHIRADPQGFLGPEQVAAFGDRPALLVKLLHTAQRLFVHYHPDDAFAQQHLDCRFGKSEAWYVIDTEGTADGIPGQVVYLGFNRDVTMAEVRAWVRGQHADEMLSALNRIEVRPGDSFFVPAGLPHAIGPGVTLVELQEPTDFSVLLEWRGYGLGSEEAHLGLGFDLALQALDRTGWRGPRLDGGLRTVQERPTGQQGVRRIFPPAADRFFRAELIDGSRGVLLTAEFGILVVLDGSGTLTAGGSEVPLRRGSAFLLPFRAGVAEVSGDLRAIRCLPPLKAEAAAP